MISAVLIVKNEEAMLSRCLDSLKGKVDEIVICDTGSTDKTVEIAEKYGKVVHFEWCDDFSKARNYAKSHATNDWILSIDADEILQGELEIQDTKKAMLLTLKGSLEEGESQAVRLFNKELDWSGAIHEYIETESAGVCDATILFGRSPTHDTDPNRNLRILLEEYKKQPTPRIVYYLGRELISRGKYEEAKSAFLEYNGTFIAEKSDAYCMIALCEYNVGNLSNALVFASMSLALNPDFQAPYWIAYRCTNDTNWREHANICQNSNVLQTYTEEFLFNIGKPHSYES